MSVVLRDILAENLSVVFCGINPGLTAAKSGHHFSSPSNRFWRVIHLAGFTPMQIRAEDDRSILQFGCGLTTAAPRATRSADELSPAEFIRASAALERKIRRYAPRTVAFLGKAAYSVIAGRPVVEWGAQASPFADTAAWVVPNPSGLNRAFTLNDLVAEYRMLRLAAQPR